MNIKCGKCKSTHETVAAVRACYGHGPSTTTESEAHGARQSANANGRQEVAAAYATQHSVDPFGESVVNLASGKQLTFIENLCKERGVDVPENFATLTGGREGTASKEISRLLAMPKPAHHGSSAAGEPVDGIYVVKDEKEDRIYKVYKMVHGSGRQGVKRLVFTEAGGGFTYIGLASRHLPTDAVLMSLEEAKAFGRIYGFCVRCGATLTDEESIAAGIGPICSGKGW